MRLAVVVNSFPVVSETFIYNKVMGLRDAGLDVTVVAHSPRNDSPLFAARLNGSPVDFVDYSLGARGRRSLAFAVGKTWLYNPRAAMRLRRQAQKLYGRTRRAARAWMLALPLKLGEYDLIHFEYSGLAVSYLDALPLLAPAKLVSSCRGTAELVTPLVKEGRAVKLGKVFARLDQVHCVSANMLKVAERYGLEPSKGFVNYPSIDSALIRRERPYAVKQAGPFQLLSVGRLHWIKGLEYALLAVRQLVDEGYDVRYDIIGAGPEEEKLRFAIHDLNLGGSVRLLGRQPQEEVRRALESADVYLLPSLSEGISNSALEAMAMELPVVVTAVGGMAEAIRDGLDGFLVRPWQAGEMSRKIRLLLDDGALRRKMGEGGRRRVEGDFNLQRQLRCFIDKYRALLSL